MHLVWWQWILVVVGGFIGLVIALVVLLFLAFIGLFAAEHYSRRRDAKLTTRYAIVVEKVPPKFPLGPGMLGEEISMPWVYPCEGMEPECYELVLSVTYAVDTFDDDYDEDHGPQLDTVVFTATVDKQTYESATVGARVENPYYDMERAQAPAWYDAVYEVN